jgi:protein gp37
MAALDLFTTIANDAAHDAFESLRDSYTAIRDIKLHAIPVGLLDGAALYEIEWHVLWGEDIVQTVSVKCTEDFLSTGEEWLQERLAETIIARIAGTPIPSVIGRA